MPLRVNEFVIQAKFEDENEKDSIENSQIHDNDLLKLKNEIIDECLEKLEIKLQKLNGR